MPRKKTIAGFGSVVKARGKFYLQLMIQGKRYQRAIRDSTGLVVTTAKAAEANRQRTAEAIREEHGGRANDRIPLDAIEATYLEHLPNFAKRTGTRHVEATGKMPIAERTLLLNLGYLRMFVKWLKLNERKARDLQDITAAHASRFMASRAGLKASSRNRALMALRHVFKVIPHGSNPFESIEPRSSSEVTEDATGHRAFTPDELCTMQSKATGWIRPAMFVGFHAGLRLGDVVTLRWEDVGADGFITKVQRKTGKREIIYCPEALPELKAWRNKTDDTGEYVFPKQAAAYLGLNRKRDTTLPGRQFSRFLNKTCGFNTKDAAGNVVLGFHSLRTSNATYARRAGEDLSAIQKRLAHSSERTTNGYLDITDEDVRGELKRAHIPLALPGSLAPTVDTETERQRLARLASTADIASVREALQILTRGNE